MTKSTITRERAQQIFLGNGPEPSASEERELARMTLVAMDSEPVELPLDYLQGHKDGLEWAAQLAEANHPETGDWLYDDPIELSKAIRKGPDMPPVQPVADSEKDRNPVLAYADSYRDMAKQGVESVPIWSVITDLERNIAPLYLHAQPATVVPDEKDKTVDADDHPLLWSFNEGWNACRAVMLAAATQSPGSEPATVPCKWIPVSEQMPEDRKQVILWDAEIGEVTSGHYSHKTQTFYHCGDAIENEITHWMPLPAAPQEVSDA
ncbi:TPA: DUF551 domain-containing protein [Klebsiella quasipneumoniae]